MAHSEEHCGASPGDERNVDTIAALRELVRARSADEDETVQLAGEYLRMFASRDGAELRACMEQFKARQKAAADRDCWARRGDAETVAEWQSRLEAMPAHDVVRDDFGRPVVVDVVDYLDQLAHWIASRKPPEEWRRSRSKVLRDIAHKSNELAELLTLADAPPWRSAIDLFDEDAKPQMHGTSVEVHVRHVSSRLRRQSVAGLMRNLAAKAEGLNALKEHDVTVGYVRRPNVKGATERQLARELHFWFKTRCGSTPRLLSVITDVVAMSLLLRQDDEEVSVDQVKEWLRDESGRVEEDFQ